MRQNRLRTGCIFLGVLAGMAAFQLVSAGQPAVPARIVFMGTEYVNCRLDPDYPFPVGEKTSKLRGKVEEVFGTRSLPWAAAAVGGRALFNPLTRDLLMNYGVLKGRTVEITGYAGAGQIARRYFLDGSERIVQFPMAFYVHRIAGWLHVLGHAIRADTGEVSATPTSFWIEAP